MRQPKTATLLLATAFAATTFGARARNLSDTPQRFEAPNDFIPAMFSADRKSHLSFADTDTQKNGSIDIYDGELRLSTSIPISADPDAVSKSIYQYRKCEGTWESTTNETLAKDITADQARDRVESMYGLSYIIIKDLADGSTMYVHCEWMYPGMPRQYLLYIPSGGGLGDLCFVTHSSLKDFRYLDGWEEPVEIIQSRGESYIPFTIRDFDSASAALGTATATQTLFNSDASYEYIAPVYETHETYTDETETVKTKKIGTRITGLRVMSESGAALQAVRFGEGLRLSDSDNPQLSMLLIGGHRYLSCNVTDGKDYYNLFYEITGGEAGLRQAAAPLKTRVYPTSVSAGESVTIDAGESQAIFHINDTAGKSLYSGEIAAGEGTSEVPASAMSRGVNIVTVSTPGHESESTKVIVR